VLTPARDVATDHNARARRPNDRRGRRTARVVDAFRPLAPVFATRDAPTRDATTRDITLDVSIAPRDARRHRRRARASMSIARRVE